MNGWLQDLRYGLRALRANPGFAITAIVCVQNLYNLTDRSDESLGTGVPGAIAPVIEGTANAAPEVRAELERIFTAAQPFDLYACAASADEYVEKASRLIEDPEMRARSGAANREFVRAFLSCPEAEARKFLDHLDAIFATSPSAIETT